MSEDREEYELFIERRRHDPLREMVDTVCKDLVGGTQERIRNVARKAYYLGVGDGILLQREKNK